MGTQTVVHKSKPVNNVLNFAASENNLSWAFTAEGDGEIYINPLTTGNSTNVASLTINGSTPTYPFAVTNGSQYSIVVIKTTNGQTASVTFKTRRSIEKTITSAVPVFAQYSGRWLYILMTNGTVQKHDGQLLRPANYVGGGAWTVTSLVSTITLPTLPNSVLYSCIDFVIAGGEERMIVSGSRTATQFELYCSFIRVSDDTVWNIAMTVQNSYTLGITISVSTYGQVKNSIYDFINNYYYIKTQLGAGGTTVIKINLSTNIFTNLGYSLFSDQAILGLAIKQFQFNPIDQRFIAIGNFSPESERTYCYQSFPNNSNIWGYSYGLNYSLTTGDTFGNLNYFNSAGKWMGQIIAGKISGVFGCRDLKGFHRTNQVFMAYNDKYSIINYSGTPTAKFGTSTLVLGTPNNFIINLTQSVDGGLFFAFSGNTSFVPSNRLIVFDTTQTTADFGYLDFAGLTPYMMATNQLMI